jgi:predicted Fe-Mo cluster-binding NifX family protein
MPLPLLLFILPLAALVAGCTGVSTTDGQASPYPMAVADDSGRVLTFHAAPMRIVSLSPSGTETLYALGLGDRIVGVDVNSNYPAEARSRPQMGGMTNVSVDRVVTAKPDLVLVSQFTPAETVNELSAAGINVYCSHPDNASDTERAIMDLGRVLGVPDDHDLQRMARGIVLDGRRTAPADVRLVKTIPGKPPHGLIAITIHEGRNRQVRRMCEAIGHPVVDLRRVRIGPLADARLKLGTYRALTAKEVTALKKAVEVEEQG